MKTQFKFFFSFEGFSIILVTFGLFAKLLFPWASSSNVSKVLSFAFKICSYRAYEATIPLHLRRYVATSLHAYAVWKMGEAYEKQRKYPEAVKVMEILVAQDVYIPYYKGKIFDRLALDYGTHLKNLDKASFFFFESNNSYSKG